MKNLTINFTLILIVVLAVSGFKLSHEPDKFVQFYVSAIENREKATELSEHLKSKDGVKMCRVDAVGKTVYVIYSNNNSYSESDFQSFLGEKGYQFTCFYSGTYGVDAFKVLEPSSCE